MPSTDEQLLAAHREWIGYVQPVGLVVAPAALLSAQAVLDRNVTDAQAQLRALLRRRGASSASCVKPAYPWGYSRTAPSCGSSTRHAVNHRDTARSRSHAWARWLAGRCSRR